MKFKENVAIGVVLFNPTQISIDRILNIASLGIRFFIFDNSPSESIGYKRKLLHHENIHFNINVKRKNFGLGYGITNVSKSAFHEGFEMIFLLDQDTFITADAINYIENFITKYKSVLKDYAAINFRASSNKLKNEKSYSIENVSFIINSGSLLILNNVNKIGYHNEDYFVDCVDYEFCLRAKYHKFKIGISYGITGFDHEIEQPDLTFKFLNKKFRVRRYGKKRILDAVTGYFKIFYDSLKYKEILFLLIMLRSFSIYLLGQSLALLFIPKKKK